MISFFVCFVKLTKHCKGCHLVMACNLLSADISLVAWVLVTHTIVDKYHRGFSQWPLQRM